MKRILLLLVLMLPYALHARPLTIIHTADLHSHMSGSGPEVEYSPFSINDDSTLGGFSRIASRAAKIRNNSAAPVFMFDSGDFSTGTLYSSIDGSMSQELPLMRLMGYDAVTPGNHDFDRTPGGLAGAMVYGIKNGGIPVILIANIEFDQARTDDDSLEKLKKDGYIRSCWVFERDGIKIGVFGIMGRHAAGMSFGASPVRFSDPVEAAKEQVRTLRELQKVDLVVCLSHGGIHDAKPLSEDEILAEKVDGIDVILGGHSHRLTGKPVMHGGTIIVNSGWRGEYMGLLDLDVNPGNVRLLSWRLEPVDDSMAGDTLVENKVISRRSQVDRHLVSMYGMSSQSILSRTDGTLGVDKGESSLGHLVADAIRWYAGDQLKKVHDPDPRIDLAVEVNGSLKDGMQRGKSGLVSVADVYRAVPCGTWQGDSIVTFYVTGAEIRRALEVTASLVPLKGDDFCLQVSGIYFSYNPNRMILDRVRDVRLVHEDGTSDPVDISKGGRTLYRVALSMSNAGFLSILGGNTFGILEIVPKDRNGNRLADLSGAVIDRDLSREGIQDAPVWLALAHYLKRMPDRNADGITEILPVYFGSEKRMEKIATWNPVSLFKGAQWITWAGLAVNIMLFSLFGLFVLAIIRRIREMR